MYSTFDGELANWFKFKRGVLALAATHNLLEIFDEGYSPPQNVEQDKDLFDAKNTFVYSIWSARIFGTHPQTLLRQFELTRDGRGAYQEFLDYYESHRNME